MYGRGKKLDESKPQKQSEHDYYKPISEGNFWNNNYIEHESNGDRNKHLSLHEYLEKTRPYLRDIIIDVQESDTWKIQLTITINFISSKDAEEEHAMHSKSNNITFTYYNGVNEVFDELFKSLNSRYEGNLETSIRGSNFIFDSVKLL